MVARTEARHWEVKLENKPGIRWSASPGKDAAAELSKKLHPKKP